MYHSVTLYNRVYSSVEWTVACPGKLSTDMCPMHPNIILRAT